MFPIHALFEPIARRHHVLVSDLFRRLLNVAIYPGWNAEFSNDCLGKSIPRVSYSMQIDQWGPIQSAQIRGPAQRI